MTDRHPAPAHGRAEYLQLPATELAASARFYRQVFGWEVDDGGGFSAPGLIGQLTTDLAAAAEGGALLWWQVAGLADALQAAQSAGGRVLAAPVLDGGQRWLAEVADPAGNRLGLVAPARRAQPQPMLAVLDVEASSRWYQQVFGLTSAHGGAEYERLEADGTLVLQLHQRAVDHHHGQFADPAHPVGNGVLVWFGEVSDFDGVVARAAALGARLVREPHRNPPPGGGNGPGHREVWIADPDGYVVVAASPDGEAWELS